jgi:hypothetical protein
MLKYAYLRRIQTAAIHLLPGRSTQSVPMRSHHSQAGCPQARRCQRVARAHTLRHLGPPHAATRDARRPADASASPVPTHLAHASASLAPTPCATWAHPTLPRMMPAGLQMPARRPYPHTLRHPTLRRVRRDGFTPPLRSTCFISSNA